jgi:putative PIN family toxin of toxin-antitoxin system
VIRVVLDSNVVVSSFIVPVGAPARIMAAWRAERLALLISEPVLAEYERALNYPRVRRRHGLTPRQVAREVAAIRAAATVVSPGSVPRVVPADPDDDQILACALTGGADFIVSGDRHLLDLRDYRGIRILPPAAFVALLATEETDAGSGSAAENSR